MTPAELRALADRCTRFHIEDVVFQEILKKAADDIERLQSQCKGYDVAVCQLVTQNKRLELAEAVCEAASKAMDSAVIKYAPYASYSEVLLNLENALKVWRQARSEGGDEVKG